MKKSKLYIFISLLFIYILFITTSSVSSQNEKNNILILNSYHKGFSWSDNIVKGIENVLYNENNSVRIEYMDTRTISSDKYLSNLYELYKNKYANKKFDVIIASDNAAYNFLKKYHKKLFGKTPVVCCGLNEYDKYITNSNNLFTGISENIDVKDTINVALDLHPNTKNIYILSDNSYSGKINSKLAKEIIPIYGNKINFHFIQNKYINVVLEKLEKIPPDSLILLNGVYKDLNNNFIPNSQANRILSKACKVPIYSCWESYIVGGVVGGKAISGFQQGKTSAKLALRLLNGENIKNIPFQNQGSNRYIFDYNALLKYNISKSHLPSNSIIKNTPNDFLTIHRSTVYFILIIVILILSFLCFTLYNNFKKAIESEYELSKEKKILKSILNSTDDGILVISDKEKVIHFNKSFKKIWNIPKNILKNDDRKELLQYAKNKISYPDKFVSKVYQISKLPYRHIDKIELKNEVILERTYQPFIVDNERKGIVWVFRDVTKKNKVQQLHKEIEIKQKLLEEAKKYDNIKTQFFSNISHELKTPLNIILSIVQLINKTYVENNYCEHTDKLQNYLNKSKQNCFRLLKLINNLIDITKIDSGHIVMNCKEYNIINLIENITLSTAEYIEEKGINLVFDTEIEELMTSCDADKIDRIMLNLLSNAVKYSEKGDTIYVNISNKNKFIQISVKDTGTGIPEDMQGEIFERFKQVDSSLRKNAEGSGIGLSLVKSLVELHNGSIKVNSELGKGSEFIIELPIIKSVQKDIDAEIAASKQPNVEKINIEFSDIYS